MLTDLQIKWIEALRSNKYEQGRYLLQNKTITTEGELCTRYCCLGVAYHLLHPDQVTRAGFLPASDYKKLGLFDETGQLKNPFRVNNIQITSLVALNDEVNWTFKQIADFIEANPEEVFHAD